MWKIQLLGKFWEKIHIAPINPTPFQEKNIVNPKLLKQLEFHAIKKIVFKSVKSVETRRRTAPIMRASKAVTQTKEPLQTWEWILKLPMPTNSIRARSFVTQKFYSNLSQINILLNYGSWQLSKADFTSQINKRVTSDVRMDMKLNIYENIYKSVDSNFHGWTNIRSCYFLSWAAFPPVFFRQSSKEKDDWIFGKEFHFNNTPSTHMRMCFVCFEFSFTWNVLQTSLPYHNAHPIS